MKVLILAGGYGTRLKEIAQNRPKPLLPINDQPLLNYVLECLKDLDGLSEVLVVTNAKFYDQFSEWAGGLNFAHPVKVINDGTTCPDDRLGSIGDIEFVIDNENISEDLLVVGGDNLFDFNLKEYIAFAQATPESVSIGAYDIEDIGQASKFGVLSLGKDGLIESFEEKPENPRSSLVAMCFYYLPKQTLELVSVYLKETNKADRAGDYIQWLCEKGQVFGFKFTGKWYDIGSVEAYHEAQQNFI